MKILSVQRSGPDLLLRFWSFAGRNYVMESAAEVTAEIWQQTDLGPGNGQAMVVTDTNAIIADPQRFYRIREGNP
ncbi:MAG TPA: hypothetical protein PKA41_06375 [Verrucomicrobiota bacterium]|nr:hypothetical protein [Verrucomicrobiota bacterium]